MKLSILLLICFFATSLHAHTLEEAFEKMGGVDKTSMLELAVGTNLASCVALTPNIEARAIFIDKIGVRLNVNVVPSKKLLVMPSNFPGFYHWLGLYSPSSNVNLGIRYYLKKNRSIIHGGMRAFLEMTHFRENLHVRNKSFPSFGENATQGNYVYGAEPNASYVYKLRSFFTGLDFGFEYNAGKRLVFAVGINYMFGTEEFLCDGQNSSNIQWTYDTPTT